MFRFTIRDVLWLTVVAGLSLALRNEHNASRSERAEKESAIFWSKTLQRSIENNGFTTGDGDLGYVDLTPRVEGSTDKRR